MRRFLERGTRAALSPGFQALLRAAEDKEQEAATARAAPLCSEFLALASCR